MALNAFEPCSSCEQFHFKIRSFENSRIEAETPALKGYLPKRRRTSSLRQVHHHNSIRLDYIRLLSMLFGCSFQPFLSLLLTSTFSSPDLPCRYNLAIFWCQLTCRTSRRLGHITTAKTFAWGPIFVVIKFWSFSPIVEERVVDSIRWMGRVWVRT